MNQQQPFGRQSGVTRVSAMVIALLIQLVVDCRALACDKEVLSNLLAKASVLKSYCLNINGTAVIDPKDSGYTVRMEFAESRQLSVKRTGKAILLHQAGTATSKPVLYPEGLTTVSNLVVYDGRQWYDVEYQSRSESGVTCEDPKRTCKLLCDADTIISELLNDPEARHSGNKEVDGIICEVFVTRAAFFSPYTTKKRLEVEVALDQSSGLPVRMSFNTEGSTGLLRFVRTRTGEKIDRSLFRAPPGVKFQEATRDGHGGWTTRLVK
jgi:hypothetical protein